MYYISDEKDGKYGVLDTKDNIIEYLSKEELYNYIVNLNVKIYGVTLDKGKLYIKVIKSSETAIEMAKRLLVDSIYKSANLEGLGTTFPKTESILNNIPTQTSRDEMLFILNMKNAWYFLLDNINYSSNLSFLRELNKIVGTNLFYNCGNVRSSIVEIGGTSWIPDIPIESLIYENLDRLNSIVDTELKALKFFCYVARTQIFIDDNKRVAQLMANKILIENNIGIFQIPVDKLEDFKILLIKFYETNDDTKIIKFMKIYCIKRIKEA